MTLDEYLSNYRHNDTGKIGLTEAAFAAKCGVSHSRIHRLRKGEKPSWDAIEAIRVATGGAVKPNDWLETVRA